ncbi:predicted protein [Chaetomium globosum CBS 148.51]|uniref:Uncharacterized protein n=1 Tax=Chaetomium globosum (strain ATCC 6205 / CBS 148.51 / DSM 1962 / NBRC 6347 / NRRL 1970) TaxID=306901 RepID=Q2HD26_CHAGB|nr:uncharacterized protein CHGG_01878 [Chaetomium globosum CBS 148.51]EAQ93643.1 predicted protein [Chaetomium globosum CBS 148.51]
MDEPGRTSLPKCDMLPSYVRKRVSELAESGHELMAQSMPCLSQFSSGSLTVELGMEPVVRILPGQSWANKQPRREEVALLVP